MRLSDALVVTGKSGARANKTPKQARPRAKYDPSTDVYRQIIDSNPDPDEAISKIYDLASGRVYSRLRSRVGRNDALIEQLQLKTFSNLRRAVAGRYAGLLKGPVIAYTLQIAHRVALDSLRSPLGKPGATFTLDNPFTSGFLPPQLHRRPIDPISIPVLDAFFALPEEDREVLEMRLIHDCQPKRIAIELGIPAAKVYAIVQRGKLVLRQAAGCVPPKKLPKSRETKIEGTGNARRRNPKESSPAADSRAERTYESEGDESNPQG